MNILQMAAVAALFLAFKRRGHSLGPYYSLDTVTASITAANANILEPVSYTHLTLPTSDLV